MKKNIWLLIIGVVIVIGSSYVLLSADKQTEKEEAIKKEEILKEASVIKNLANKYQAIIIDEEEELIYTLQVQERFIVDKPVLFTGAYVDDIFNRDGKTFIRFSSPWVYYNEYLLELECNREIVDKILAQNGGNSFNYFDGEYVIVANIKEVFKPVFEIKGSTISEDEVEIDIDFSYLFIAKGICVDVIYINDNE